jgi:cation-transporting ATPase E
VKGLPKELLPFALLEFGEKIRDDAAETLQYFHDQGVDLKVISGDNPVTVVAVAAAVGIANIKTYDARKLPEATDQLGAVLDEYNVFGRVTPEQKRQMVKALQANGHVVAMTGDGVNDALALKDADVGIAMRSGAAATRAVAELVLLDNSFAHMPRVVAEGRRVIANIERVANLFLIKNVYSLALALAVTVATLPYPFLPRHMTILSSLTIGIPAFFLALAPNLQRYHPGFLKRVLRFAVPAGITIALLIFVSYLWVRQSNGSAALASTVAALTVMGVGTWTLLCLARPLAAWKVALVLAMPTLFAAGLVIPFLRTFFDLTITMQWAINAAGLIAVGALLVELQWRWASRQFVGRTQRQ